MLVTPLTRGRLVSRQLASSSGGTLLGVAPFALLVCFSRLISLYSFFRNHARFSRFSRVFGLPCSVWLIGLVKWKPDMLLGVFAPFTRPCALRGLFSLLQLRGRSCLLAGSIKLWPTFFTAKGFMHYIDLFRDHAL